jgi:hypothetical protein
VSQTAGAALPGSAVDLALPTPRDESGRAPCLSFLLAEAGRGEVTPGEAEKLARLVSEHHKGCN